MIRAKRRRAYPSFIRFLSVNKYLCVNDEGHSIAQAQGDIQD